MKRIRRVREKIVLHPVMTFCFLILITIVLSGILTIFNVSSSYNKISNTGAYVKEYVFVENLFSLSGVKYMFSSTVSNFAEFTPLSMLIITLIGVGIMDASGFLDSFFYILTKRVSKRTVTFSLSLVCILASIGGDLSYIVLIPMAALLFKYGKRNPKAGIICAFAGLSCGIGINILMNSIDSTLMNYTLSGAQLISNDYGISTFSYVLIMLVAAVILAFINTSVTEKYIVSKVGHYDLMDEKEDYLTRKEKKGLVISLFAGIIYILVFIYNIIPNAPLGGNLLDYSQKLYIDKLFGYNSFFNQGFVFVVTLLFFILGITYGIVTKSIKNQHDVGEFLGYSLDKVGKVLVLIFFASAFIFIFKKTNIGTIIAASLVTLFNKLDFSGLPLIFLLFIISAVSTIFLPGTVNKWAIFSGTVVPKFMNSGLSPEFATAIFRAGECATYALTPIMAYFVIYLAFMELYSVNDHEGLFGNMKYLIPYSVFAFIMWFVIILCFYFINLPLGFGAFPAL